MIGFAKYHGCGNSFVIVREKELPPCDFSTLALHMCNSATGIGADGLIVVREEPALEMIFYNMDGSRAPMCGNGIRCFAAYCVDKKISPSLGFSVVTLAGTMDVKVVNTDPYMIRIGMGRPDFSPSSLGIIPVIQPRFTIRLCAASHIVTVASITVCLACASARTAGVILFLQSVIALSIPSG